MELWPITIDARHSLLATFETLDDDQWAVPSLAGGWTMRELLAHLILAARPQARRYAVAVARAKGNFDQANDALARSDAEQPTEQLLDNYRAVINHRFAPPGWPTAAPLSDILLHTLDARIPLEIETVEAPEHYTPVMGLLFGLAGRSFTRGGRPTLTWTAADCDWSHGSGPTVSGEMADLALSASGRGARVDQLDGDGVEQLAAWLP